jgi:hypothetical protein
LVGKLERKGPLGRPRRRWKDNIKINLKELGLDVVNLIHLAHNRDHGKTFVNTVMNLRVP